MKNIFLILLVSFAITNAMNGQVTLTIEILGLRNSNGQVHLELSNDLEVQVKGASQSITQNKCTFIIENLKPGKYSFKFIHDENMNNKLDTNWIGIPKEGFGFSNNPKMTFGPPSFEKTLFELIGSTELKCNTVYF
jgi:uncharacterized protein (DUF2141 family)